MMRAQGTCSCGQSRAFDNLDEFDQFDALDETDTLDELDDVADWAESDVLDEEAVDELDLFSEEDALTGRARSSAGAGAGAGRLGFVLTCTDPQRRQRFRAALRLAISIARTAAARLTAPRIDNRTRDLFIHFFGTRPDHRPSWATRTAAGLVAHRYTMVARELAGGRRFRYTCVSGTVGDCATSAPGRVVVAATTGKSAVTLCDAFFAPGRSISQMAGTLLHEGMHAVYQDLFFHAVARGIAECRRDNARCFQAFALRVRGFGVESDIRTRCRRSAAQCRRLLRDP